MASLDNIYEIADRLKDDNIDYFIVAIQKGKKKMMPKFSIDSQVKIV